MREREREFRIKKHSAQSKNGSNRKTQEAKSREREETRKERERREERREREK